MLALFFTSSLTWLSAQQWRYLPEEEASKKSAEALQKADYVFEGYGTSGSEFFYNEDSTQVFTSSILVVTYSYKGNLKKGTIELVRPYTGEEHLTGYGLNQRYIFVCQKSDFPLNPNGHLLTNSQPVKLFSEYIPCLGFEFRPDSITYAVAGLYGRKFRTKDDFYKFLKQSSDNITLPPQESEGKENMPLPSNNPPIYKPDTAKGGGNYRLGNASETIKYSIRNQRIYNANGKNYYAFDFYGEVFTTDLHLVEASAILKFNKPTFGVNPVGTTRWKWDPGPGLQTSSITVSGSNSSNDTVIEIRIFPDSFSPPNDTFRLLTVRLEVGLDTVCCKWSGLSFVAGDEYAAYYFNSPNNLLIFDVEITPTQNYKLCTQPMTINSVSPLLVHAGNGEILEIRGKGFGTSKGEVLFKNADIGGVPSPTDSDGFLDGLDSIWVDTWKDTLIRVKVPSHVTKGSLNGLPQTAGSGPIIVKQSPCGDTLRSTQQVNIEYAFINYADQSQQPYIIDKFYIPRRYCINGFVFTFDTSIQHHPYGYLMIQVANEAFMRWSSLLGITITYEKNAAGNAPFFTNNRNDPERNVIYLTGSTEAMSYFPVRVLSDSTNGIKKYYKDKVDIKINPTVYWNYSYSGDLMLNQQDFLWAILHELGHVIGLDHDIDLVNKDSNMMNYAIPHSLKEFERANMNQWSERAKKGAQDIVAQSKTKTWTPPALATLSNFNSAILAAPSINPGGDHFICCGQNNNNVTLTASHPTETIGWFWQPNAQTTQSITTNLCGKYTVRIAPVGCAKASLPSVPTFIKPKQPKDCPIIGDPDGHDEERMSVQPNPANFEAQVYYEALALEGNHRIQVVSGSGSIVENILVSELSGDITFYTGSWPSGTYWAIFRNDAEVIDTDELVIIH